MCRRNQRRPICQYRAARHAAIRKEGHLFRIHGAARVQLPAAEDGAVRLAGVGDCPQQALGTNPRKRLLPVPASMYVQSPMLASAVTLVFSVRRVRGVWLISGSSVTETS